VKLVWSVPASATVADIFAYIAVFNPNAALKVKKNILFSARKLIEFPELGKPAERPGVRLLVVTGSPYILAYSISANVVEIGSVIDGRMKRAPDLF
jgi:toxin ParE1/3/4